MNDQGIHIDNLPELKDPYLITGFDGWGNALNVSKATATYLVYKLKAEDFARINPDFYYRYDESRPWINVTDGTMKSFSPPGGTFYAAKTGSDRDMVILSADEPQLRWFNFMDELFALCKSLNIRTIISLGSMYDEVLHTDRMISAISFSEESMLKFRKRNVGDINYKGPGAIHSIIQSEGQKRGIDCISIWCHCAHYLQNTIHYGMLVHLIQLLAYWGDFDIDTEDIEESWINLKGEIEGLIEQNSELQEIVDELRKEKIRGSWENIKESINKDEKVISLKDFFDKR